MAEIAMDQVAPGEVQQEMEEVAAGIVALLQVPQVEVEEQVVTAVTVEMAGLVPILRDLEISIGVVVVQAVLEVQEVVEPEVLPSLAFLESHHIQVVPVVE
jgi:hypothetical protein